MYEVSSHLLSPQLLHSLSLGRGSEVSGTEEAQSRERKHSWVLNIYWLIFFLGHLG